MIYPTPKQVENASIEDLASWHRFLPSPVDSIEVLILNDIEKKFKELGMFTPGLSKFIGWTPPK